jgi:ORF6N domain
MSKSLVRLPARPIDLNILIVRDEKVILDSDLAALYGVGTRVLVQAFKRNRKRFPEDFVFQLTKSEFDGLKSQSVISKGRGGRRSLPYAFTEHGAVMAANLLNSERAIETSVEVVRAFVRLRKMVAANAELARKLDTLEKQYDEQFKVVFAAIRQLMTPPAPKPKQIGFRSRAHKK